MSSMYDDLKYVLITKEQISERVKAIAGRLEDDYRDKNPLMVAILKGSVMFFSDLVKNMKIPLGIDFMAISSYGSGTRSSGEVRVNKDLDKKIEGRHVIIVEDIVDSGYTLMYLKRMLGSRNPASIKICTLLDKKSRRETPITPDYYCFDVADEFVVGYGLDYSEKYRNLPEIGVLKEEIYQ